MNPEQERLIDKDALLRKLDEYVGTPTSGQMNLPSFSTWRAARDMIASMPTRHTPSIEGGVKQAEADIRRHMAEQFPAVVGHLEFARLLYKLECEAYLAGQKSSGEMAHLLKEVTHHMTLTYRDEEWQWESIRLQDRVTALLSQLESKGEV